MALFDLPRLVWPGRYSDGRTAAPHAVQARIAEDGLAIKHEDDTPGETWPFDEVRLVDGPDSSGAIRLARLGGDARLSLEHRDALSAIELRCARLHDGMGGESAWHIITLWCVAALAAVALLIFAVIPFMARHASRWMSPTLEAELGNRVADVVMTLTVAAADQAHAECNAPAGRAALDTLVAPLAAQLRLRNPVRVRVINSRIVNALALPGGQILLFRGLLDFTQGPNEIAGVTAHEMGHLVLDHPMTMVIEQSSTAFVIGLLLGDIFGGSAVAIAATAVLDTAFSRKAESAADGEAVTLMAGAGLDVRPLGAFFARLGASQRDSDMPIAFLRSHPPSDPRAKLIEAAPAGGRQALDAAQWAALKAICD